MKYMVNKDDHSVFLQLSIEEAAKICADLGGISHTRVSSAGDQLHSYLDSVTCTQPNPCGDGDPCDKHERELAHAEGEHALCDDECEESEGLVVLPHEDGHNRIYRLTALGEHPETMYYVSAHKARAWRNHLKKAGYESQVSVAPASAFKEVSDEKLDQLALEEREATS